MSQWTSLTAEVPMTWEEKQQKKRETIKRQAKFRKVIDNMPKLKGFELKKESDEYLEKMQKEKEFLFKGIAEGKVKSPRLLKLGKDISHNKKRG